MLVIGYSVKSQELLFKVTQAGAAYRNTKSGRFTNVEVNDIQGTILLRKNKLIVDAEKKASYTLIKKEAGSNLHSKVLAYTYNGKDENDAVISFMYKLNLTSKEAVIELANDKIKTYYFGTFSSPDLTIQ